MSWIGKPVRRIEDERLLKGQAKFVADVKLPETLEAVLRSMQLPHATFQVSRQLSRHSRLQDVLRRSA